MVRGLSLLYNSNNNNNNNNTYTTARERLSEHGYLNGDGFGLGWYPAASSPQFSHLRFKPCVFTRFVFLTTTTCRHTHSPTLIHASTGPAWNNENLARLALSIQTPLMFAHVRAATIGTKVCECK